MLVITFKLLLLSLVFVFISLIALNEYNEIREPKKYKYSKTMFKVSSIIFCASVVTLIVLYPVRLH